MNFSQRAGKINGALCLIFFCLLIAHADKNTAEGNPPLPVVIVPHSLPGPEGGDYVGAEGCTGCHAQQYRQWQTSRHARALSILDNDGQQSSCLRCHSTGYGEQSGFINSEQTPRLAGVQCEACHGRGSRHLENVTRPGWGIITGCVDCQIKKVCMVCHTPKHSPNFDFEEYLKKVRCEAE